MSEEQAQNEAREGETVEGSADLTEEQVAELQQKIAEQANQIMSHVAVPAPGVIQFTLSAHPGSIPGLAVDLFMSREICLMIMRQLKEAYDMADPDRIQVPEKKLYVPGE